MTKAELLNDIRPFIEFSPKYINVTCHRDEVTFEEQSDGTYRKHLVRRRVSETAVCGAIQSEFKVDVVPHLICGGITAEQIEFQLQDLKFMGISNVLALRGDCLAGEKRFSPVPGGYTHANELVEAIRRFEKENGCEGFFRMFFDNKVFYNFVDRCRKDGINVPIIPGLKPISTQRQVSLLPKSFSIDIPFELTSEIEAHKDDKEAVYRIGQEWATAQCRDLLAHGVPGVHFYTMGKSSNVIGILRECF